MRIKNLPRLIVSILICQFVGIIGSVFTASEIPGWYRTLRVPWYTPSGGTIAAVWVILFALMGVALYLVWQEFSYAEAAEDKKTGEKIRKGFMIFAVQLALNVLWSYLFFAVHSPSLAFIEIILLWAAIYFTIRQFSEASVKAAYLLIPYLVWVSFAAVLNFSVWRLNL